MRSLIRQLEEGNRPDVMDTDRAGRAYIWDIFDKYIKDQPAEIYIFSYEWGDKVRVGRTWVWSDTYAKTPALQNMKVLETRMMKPKAIPGYRKPQPSKQVLLDFGEPKQPPKLDDRSENFFWVPKELRVNTVQRGVANVFSDAHLEKGAQEEMEIVYARVGMKDAQVVPLRSRGDFKMYGAWVRALYANSEKAREWPTMFVICAVYTGDVVEPNWDGFERFLASFNFGYHIENHGSVFDWWEDTHAGRWIRSMYMEMRKIDAKRADDLWKKYGGDKPEPKK